jgi:SAM-dependent methyltransferase
MTAPYTALATAYDFMLSHVDYEQWYRYLRSIMFQYVEDPRYVLELGCGTGKFGAKFSRDNITVFGMDRSIDMLRVAKSRAYNNFHIFCGDMSTFAVAKKFNFIFSVHDTMNYFMKESMLRRVLRSVRSALDTKGVFMFDITTEHNIRRYFEGKVMRYNVRGTEIEWNNAYERKTRTVTSTLSFTGRGGATETEVHLQRIYTVREIRALLKAEKLRVLDIFGDYTFSPPDENTVMINFITGRA